MQSNKEEKLMNHYNFKLDIKGNDTNAFIIKHIEPNSRILEFGPAYGRLTKFLFEERHCLIDIIEIDKEAGEIAAKYCKNAFLGEEEGNIEKFFWKKQLKQYKYDYIIFADVLEHLKDPRKVLEECKDMLSDYGRIIVSIPNIAHNAIIVNLFKDQFPYNDTGLLDSTHITFFTDKSFREYIEEIGFFVVDYDFVKHSVYQTEFNIGINSISRVLRKLLSEHLTGQIYQNLYVLKTGKKVNECKRNLRIENEFYAAACYYSERKDDYCSEKKYCVSVSPEHCNQLVFTGDELKQANYIRIDPLNVNCIIKINKICVRSKAELKIVNYVTNGYYMGDNIYLFDTELPQIAFQNDNLNIENIQIDLEYIDYDLENIEIISNTIQAMQRQNQEIRLKNQSLENEKERLKVEKEELQAEKVRLNESIFKNEQYIEELKTTINNQDMAIKGIYESISWRITYPLRKVIQFFRN